MILIYRLFFFAFITATILSCDSNKVFEEYIEVENSVWKKEHTAHFEFNALDTSSFHNLYINIRNTGDYAFSNLYMFVTIKGPDNNFTTDTVNCILADNRGKWKGRGIGDLWDYRNPFLRNVKFAQKGKYIISYEQAMREEKGLKGITDLGLRIEKITL